MDSIYKGILAYIKAMWSDFRKHVLHKEKKGHDDIWHQFTKYLLLIPFEVVAATIVFTVLLACVLLIVPIAKLFGYDLSQVFADKQAVLQSKIKPAMWIPGVSRLHAATQKWNSISPADTVYKDALDAIKKIEQRKDQGGEWIKIVESNKKDLRIKAHCFSKYKWLDVLDVKVDVGPDLGGAVIAVASSSTGCLPLILPPYVGLVLNVLLFWVPFSDFGKNNSRLDDLRRTMKVETEKEK